MQQEKKHPAERKYTNLQTAVKKMRFAQKAAENASDVPMKNANRALAKKQENKVDKLLNN